ncbi:MAG: MYXO-CTERM sorting domain-containing protein [Hyphomicrobiaceae bacterium]
MAALRFLSGTVLVFAVIALVYDGTRWQLGLPGPALTSIARHWSDFAPTTLELSRRFVSAKAHPLVWEAIAVVLRTPAAVSLTVLGLALGWLGRERRRINVFAN